MNSPAKRGLFFNVFLLNRTISITNKEQYHAWAQERERDTHKANAESFLISAGYTERRTRRRRERERQRREAGITKLMLALAAMRPRRRCRGMCIYVTNLYKYVL
jgi:hypothetical protein